MGVASDQTPAPKLLLEVFSIRIDMLHAVFQVENVDS